MPASQMQVNETLGVIGTGYALNIHTHFLNNQYASGTAGTETMGHAVNKYKESQAFSSQPTSTFKLNV
jgi:hypothetical protein